MTFLNEKDLHGFQPTIIGKCKSLYIPSPLWLPGRTQYLSSKQKGFYQVVTCNNINYKKSQNEKINQILSWSVAEGLPWMCEALNSNCTKKKDVIRMQGRGKGLKTIKYLAQCLAHSESSMYKTLGLLKVWPILFAYLNIPGFTNSNQTFIS